MDENIRTRETRLRRAAARQGLRLEKSRARDPRSLTYGTYQLINVEYNSLVAANTSMGYGLTLDQIEDQLRGTRRGKLAHYLRGQARWRRGKTDEYGDERNTRSSAALLDAANYVEQLPDDDSRLIRLDAADCLNDDVFHGGEEAGHVIRLYSFHDQPWSPDTFLDDLAAAAEHDTEQLTS